MIKHMTGFKNIVLVSLGMWEKYREERKRYRNCNLAHTGRFSTLLSP